MLRHGSMTQHLRLLFSFRAFGGPEVRHRLTLVVICLLTGCARHSRRRTSREDYERIRQRCRLEIIKLYVWRRQKPRYARACAEQRFEVRPAEALRLIVAPHTDHIQHLMPGCLSIRVMSSPARKSLYVADQGYSKSFRTLACMRNCYTTTDIGCTDLELVRV